MSREIKVTGIVLSSMPIGEYDRRLTLLTLERGKISGFARGAKRVKSAMQASANPFCFGEFEGFAGRSANVFTHAKIKEYFREFAADYEAACYGYYFLELADYFCMEGDKCGGQLRLLYQSLRALSVPALKKRLVRCVYELRTLDCQGLAPDFSGDLRHAAQKDDFFMRIPPALGDTLLHTLRHIMTAPLNMLYTFAVSEEILIALETLSRAKLARYIEKELISARAIKNICYNTSD